LSLLVRSNVDIFVKKALCGALKPRKFRQKGVRPGPFMAHTGRKAGKNEEKGHKKQGHGIKGDNGVKPKSQNTRRGNRALKNNGSREFCHRILDGTGPHPRKEKAKI